MAPQGNQTQPPHGRPLLAFVVVYPWLWLAKEDPTDHERRAKTLRVWSCGPLLAPSLYGKLVVGKLSSQNNY
eukprot:2634127-Amphidinium_carterae.1